MQGRELFPVQSVPENGPGNPLLQEHLGHWGAPIDLVVIVTPASSVPVTVEECGKAGRGGDRHYLRRVQGDRRRGQAPGGTDRAGRGALWDAYHRPNCLGLIRPSIGLNTTFVRTMPESGKIAFISHSGALGIAILNWAIDNQIGFSLFISLGSMLDVDFGDLIDYLGEEPQTKSIMIYMERVGTQGSS